MAEGGNRKGDPSSLYCNPVFKMISFKNGEINKLTRSELKKIAKELKICCEGSADVLRKRVKSHYRKIYLTDAALKIPKQPYVYYIVIDFEATCEDKDSAKVDFAHEIIEFPALVVNADTYAVESIFHKYVKPVQNKILSDYCISLTGVSQKQIDTAEPFPQVLQKFMQWMQEHNLFGQSAIVTDGPWDMARFLYTQVKLSKLPYPKFAKRWVNIKKTFSNFYNQRKPTLDVMLKQLNFEFEGRRHSGIDDSYNIARVLIQMLKDGACVQINERIDLSSFNSHVFRPVNDLVKTVNAEDMTWRRDETVLKICSDETKDCSRAGSLHETDDGDECDESAKEDVLSLYLKQNTCALSALNLHKTNDSAAEGYNYK